MIREDVFGTIGVALFDIFVIMLILIFFTEAFAPVGVSVLVTLIFGGIAIGSTYKVAKYGINKLKNFSKKKE